MTEVDSLGVEVTEDNPLEEEEKSKSSELSDPLNELRNFELDMSRYKGIRKLTKGGFGDVYVAEDAYTKSKVVIKELHHEHLTDRELQLFKREIMILVKTYDPFVIPFIGFSSKPSYSIVTRYMEGGSLWDRIHNYPEGSLNPTQKTCIALGIAHGMRTLHGLHVVHRDLKSPNILLDNRLFPKICDFGLSRFTDPTETRKLMTQCIGTPQWMAPEQIHGDYGRPVDVFAFGMLLYELLTEKVPYGERRDPATSLLAAIGDGYRPPLTGEGEVEKLIYRCWDQDSNKRPTFEEIYDVFASGLVQFVGTVSRTVRLFIRVAAAADVERVNPIANSAHRFNSLFSTYKHSRKHKRDVPQTFCCFAEKGSVKDLTRLILGVKDLDINACNHDGVFLYVIGRLCSVLHILDIV
jgi:serine/threonine protein kinase